MGEPNGTLLSIYTNSEKHSNAFGKICYSNKHMALIQHYEDIKELENTWREIEMHNHKYTHTHTHM